jgi:hypothetical protein
MNVRSASVSSGGSAAVLSRVFAYLRLSILLRAQGEVVFVFDGADMKLPPETRRRPKADSEMPKSNNSYIIQE